MNTKGVEDGMPQPEKFVCTDPECFGDCHPIRKPAESSEELPPLDVTDEEHAAACKNLEGEEHGSVLYCIMLHERKACRERQLKQFMSQKKQLIHTVADLSGKIAKLSYESLSHAVPVEERTPMPTREAEGSWPNPSLQRAFVEGMKWWQFHHHGSTAFPSERDEAEKEALRRYGIPEERTAEMERIREKGVSYHASLLVRLRDPSEAFEYILAARQDSLEAFKKAIANVYEAHQPTATTVLDHIEGKGK